MRSRLLLMCSLLATATSLTAILAFTPAVAAQAAAAAPERVEVKRGSSWYPATVIKREGNKALVHYEGLSSDFDEWVGPERMREAAVRPTAPPEPREAPPKQGPKEKPDKEAAPPEIEDEENEPGDAPKRITRADYAGAKRVNGDTSVAPRQWQLTADPQTAAQAKMSNVAIALFRENEGPEKLRRFGENLESPLFAGPGVARAIVPRYWHRAGKDGKTCRLELLDLGVGRSVTLVEMPVDTKALDLSPDGNSVLLCNEKWGDEDHTRLDVFFRGRQEVRAHDQLATFQ